MKIETTVVGPVDIINIEGGIMQENVAHFKKALHDLLDANKIRIVLNIEKTNYLSSMSLSVIFAARNKARGNGGDLKLANPNNLGRNPLNTSTAPAALSAKPSAPICSANSRVTGAPPTAIFTLPR